MMLYELDDIEREAMGLTDHAEMVQRWLDECAANGWNPEDGSPLTSDSAPSPWVA